MDERSTEREYDAEYYARHCGDIPYERDDRWLRFFADVADRIVDDIGPRSVLDVGCAMGFLVEALRSRGVEAYGVDISPHAIDNVHPDIAAFCSVGRATDPIDRRYDLIVCIEVLEHLGGGESAQAIGNFCAHADDVLISSEPFDFKELTHLNVQPPDHWAGVFAREGFVRDVEFDASFLTPWAMRFRKSGAALAPIVRAYERRLWQLAQERSARRELAVQQRTELAERDRQALSLRDREETVRAERDDLAERLQASSHEVQVLASSVRAWEHRWWELETSMAWAAIQRLQSLRVAACPAGSRRERTLLSAYWWYQLRQREGFSGVFRQLRFSARRKTQLTLHSIRQRSPLPGAHDMAVAEIEASPKLLPHAATVDVIVCVHNALNDVRLCLESVARYSAPPVRLIIVDDGSQAPTADYVAEFARAHGALHLRNDEAGGYTLAANQGMRASDAEYVVLLNSDTVVSGEWLDRLVACAESDSKIGIVGPLSNTASWQSIPRIFEGDDWASNPLPEGVDVDSMVELVASRSARLYPELSFLNGFCLLIKRALIDDVGLFDEERFGAGYGEENDLALRARASGWRLVVADDVYVYHAQSKSYSDERRMELYERANAALVEKHDQHRIDQGVAQCRDDRVMAGIRAYASVLAGRRSVVDEGSRRFAGKRVLFVLPVMSAGGGANVVIGEAQAMLEMGVDVALFNLDRFRDHFERAYPELDIPVVYGRYHEVPQSLADHVDEFDAMVGTIFASVRALSKVSKVPGGDRLQFGYYIQDFEPYFFDPGSDEFHRAWQSYKLMPQLKRFTKTEWNRREIEMLIGIDSTVVGPSFDIDLFRPRPRTGPEHPDRPLRIAAMIRPETPYRNPRLTMELLEGATKQFGGMIDVVLFGCDADSKGFRELPHGFAWRCAGPLNPQQVASLLNDVDVFVDFSSHQAMGLTALEAMACGVATVVPDRGGAGMFATNLENSIVVDASSEDACRAALNALIQDDELRERLSRQAMQDAVQHFPERPALNILRTLFGDDEAVETHADSADPTPGEATAAK